MSQGAQMVPDPDPPQVRPSTTLAGKSLGKSWSRKSLTAHRILRWLLAAGLIAIAGWFLWLYGQIHYYATHDEARPADAIAVFGAAEYDGRPSPVLRSRLDHALMLYRERLAPLVITLGGGGGVRDSEGGVGHDYLLAHGVPEDQIIAETQSTNTEESAARLAAIARENHLNRILAVSDRTHLFRIHTLCASMGLIVVTSPRIEARRLGFWDATTRLMHEMFSYTLWRLKIH
jgi:uncharacterized SAM-binding protein YcdF (DUF218 family)